MTDIAAVMLRPGLALLIVVGALAGVPGMLVGMTQPAAAQSDGGFFSPFSSSPNRRQQPSWQSNRQPFWLWGQPQSPPNEPRREREVDYSKAPPPRKQDTAAAKHIVVMGDATADWLAYGLEDAFSDTPEIGIVRKHRTNSGLIHGESRNAYDWPQAARDILANDQPAFIVMMIGMSDRQSIRERQARSSPPAAQPNPTSADQAAPRPSADEEAQPAPEETPSTSSPEPGRGRLSTYEFRSEQWAAAYAKRIDEMITVLKSKGVPVFWVGLPPPRGTHASADIAYLNDLYRDRAGKAGIAFVDVWDGFVDENGNFSMQGPDFEGQMRRLRSADGVYFTKAGAQKLARYVEHEIRHAMLSAGTPVAAPAPEEPQTQTGAGQPGGPAARPLSGPVVSLTSAPAAPGGLMGAGPARPPSVDSTATKFLVRGEPLQAAVGRADDFAWPRNEGLPPPPVGTGDNRSEVERAEKSDVKPAEKPEVNSAEKSDAKPAVKADAPQPSAAGSAPAETASLKPAHQSWNSPKRTHRAPAATEPLPLVPPPVPPAAADALRPPSPIPEQ